jgi:hypothetical protein
MIDKQKGIFKKMENIFLNNILRIIMIYLKEKYVK